MENKLFQVVITDTHLKRGNYEQNYHIYQNACDFAKKNGLGYVLHLGDVFDSRKSQTLDNLVFFKSILDEVFGESGVKLIVVPGNHDRVDYQSYESYLDPYEHNPSLTLIREPKVMSFEDHHLALIPFLQETTILEEVFNKFVKSKDFKDAKKSKLPIVGGIHFAVSGVMNNDGSVIDNPMKPKLFSSFDIVLSGHYHNKSVINKKIHYIGASIQHTFGETPDKGITTLDNKLKINTLYVEGAKEFKVVEANIDNLGVDGIKKLVKNIQKDESLNVYKMKIVGSKSAVKAFDSSIIKSAGIKVQKKADEDVIEYDEENFEEVEFSNKDILDEFEKFCIIQDYNKDTIKEGKNLLTIK
jgi:DNA repair exonuclease SbcCD nuclease subunit